MKQKNVYKGAIDLKVKIIDWSAINKIISEKVGKDVECRVGKGFIEDVEAVFDEKMGYEEIKSIIIDTECCGRTTEKQNFYFSELNDGVPFCVNFFENIPFYQVDEETENGKTISVFPSYEFSFDADDIKNHLTGEEMPLYQFMGSRYAYNDRISSNEMKILRLCYHKQIKEKNKNWLNQELTQIEE
jgi:hypothetical protein